jgi:hypothetical protein
MLPYLLSDEPKDGDQGQRKRLGGLKFGQEFMQKFIQLPFRVPGPDIATYDSFIETFSHPLLRGAQSGSPARDLAIKDSDGSPQEKPETPPSDFLPTGAEQIRPPKPRTSPATAKEAEIRKKRELQFGVDSPKIRAAAKMFAETQGTNPRRLKQFVNLMRLQAYIVNSIEFFDPGVQNRPRVTVEQLGKFVAINLQWPALIADFSLDRQFLEELEDYANDRKRAVGNQSAVPIPATSVSRWLNEKGVMSLLKYGIDKERTKLHGQESFPVPVATHLSATH